MLPTLAVITAGLAITVIVSTIAFVSLVVLTLVAIDGKSGPGEPDDTDPGSDDGGGGGGGNDRTGPSPGRGGDPAWWPEFEREFDRYTAGLDRDRLPLSARQPRPAP